MTPRFLLAALAVALVPALATAQSEGRLKRIKDSKTITIAHRTDAPPYSFVDPSKNPIGYSIDLCKRVVSQLEQQIGVQGITVKWLPVTTQNRFDVIAKGEADMECGSSTVTVARMKQVDFSNYIFVDSTGILARADLNARSLSDLSGKKIGVIAGTSNASALARALKERLVNATVVPLKSRDDALPALEAKTIDAFASDAILLLGLGPKVKDPASLAMLDDALSFEPYAIALPRGESAFRSEVNIALARIYRSAAIGEIYGQWFGVLGKPSGAVRAVYGMGAIPE